MDIAGYRRIQKPTDVVQRACSEKCPNTIEITDLDLAAATQLAASAQAAWEDHGGGGSSLWKDWVTDWKESG